ncbi:hypothetical protein XH83_03040 [Bradyrhizobium sp. CCBAU 53351]|uniref:hypothetical protein n=1 Tax=Bradyrhizobium sp. CCBAU 53351 TaxID=1325114 RepID=UPI00188842B2|nr:hypothetical protein [Bradyrhizobium sp. CCBAU 53351]QOZ74518.1 hypothetical protein XH83_03040 [Bradyrhizobium sp. CCBAU 53351]
MQLASHETIEVGPRRKWGWVFVVIFLVELATFGTIVSSRKAEINQLQLLATKDTIYQTNVQIQRREKEINQLYLWAAVLLPMTLLCAGFGLRRRVTLTAPASITEGGDSSARGG